LDTETPSFQKNIYNFFSSGRRDQEGGREDSRGGSGGEQRESCGGIERKRAKAMLSVVSGLMKERG
jgi:hypothetical protein